MYEFDATQPSRASQELAGKDEPIWVETLYRMHASALLAFLRQRTTSRDDAEDLLLEVFVAALERPDLELLHEQRQAVWLWRVARNKVADYHRRAARRPTLDLDRLDDLAADDVEGGILERDVLRQDEYLRLHMRLWTLTPLQRDVLRLRFAEGMRCGEIARALGKREVAVRALLSRALRSLRTVYAQQEGGEPYDPSGHAL